MRTPFVETHKRHTGDLATLLYCQLVKPDAAGVDQVVDVTSQTVEFKMVTNDTAATVIIAQTSTGVTKPDAVNGKVAYEFSTTIPPGEYRAYFVATASSKPDTFPAVRGELLIQVSGD